MKPELNVKLKMKTMAMVDDQFKKRKRKIEERESEIFSNKMK